MTAQLPPIDASLLPADVRTGSKADQQRYETGLAFERQLVQQLTQQMADTTQGADDADGGDAATASYQQMLPGALADGVMAAGGLGLARQIADSLKDAGR